MHRAEKKKLNPAVVAKGKRRARKEREDSRKERRRREDSRINKHKESGDA
jgi:hypothetical protein